MKIEMPKTIEFDDLIRNYKLLFPIFYWESNLSPSLNKKMIWLSLFLKKHIFLCSLFNMALILFILPLNYCNETNLQVAYVNIETISMANILTTLIVVSPFLLRYENFSKLWSELGSVYYLINERLNHRINFREFVHSFLISVSSLLWICLGYGILKSIFGHGATTNKFRITIVSLELLKIYIEFHAVYIIRIFQFTYKMLGKYVNFAYHLSRSNLDFPNINNNYDNLKFYKEIHFQLWVISREINKFFGISLATFCAQAFFDALYSIYFIFHYWVHDRSTWLPKTISICFDFLQQFLEFL